MKLGDWLGLICLGAALYILWQIRRLALLVFMAMVIAIALNGVVRRLQRLGIPRLGALPIVLGGCLLAITLFLVGVVPPFIEQITVLVELFIESLNQLPGWIATLQTQLPAEMFELPDLSQWVQTLNATVPQIFRNFFSFFSNSLQVVLQILLVMVLSFMLLLHPKPYRDVLLRLFPAFYRRRADEILDECEIALGNWLGGVLINSIFVFALSFFGLWMLGVRLVLAHALLAGILNFIPNIGPTVSVVFPIIVALASGEPWKVLAIVILYIVIQNIESYWLTPTVMAHQVSLLPAVTLFAQIFFTSLFGLLGLLVALPLTVVVKTWVQELLIKDILDIWGSASPLQTPPLTTTAVPIAPRPMPASSTLEGSHEHGDDSEPPLYP